MATTLERCQMESALDTLLRTHAGFPHEEPYTSGSLHMHALGESRTPSTALSGCYWVESNRVDSTVKASLCPVPTVSSLAPKSSVKPLKLLVAHPRRADVVGVPKFFGLSAFGPAMHDMRAEGHMLTSTWNDSVQLRPEQLQGLANTHATLKVWGGAFFVADCGFGKSVVIARLVHEVGRKAIIVVPRLTLVQQMLQDLGGAPSERKSLLTGCKVRVLQGSWDKCKDTLADADIVVASLDSLAQFKYPQAWWEMFGLVVFDEAHHMAAKTLSAILPHVPCKRIVGFSATPNRKDGLEPVLFWLLGPTSFVFQRLPSVTGKRGTVHVQRVRGEVVEDVFRWGGKLAFAEMLNAIAANETRNARLVALAKDLVKTRGKVLLITAFREHCDVLADALRAETQVLVLHGGSKKRKREEEDAKCIVATYGLLEEGFDDADLDTVILCTPRSTVQQTVGRIERTKEGKAVPLVVDVVDINSIFFAMWQKRKKFYMSRGFQLDEEAVPAPDPEPVDFGFVVDDD